MLFGRCRAGGKLGGGEGESHEVSAISRPPSIPMAYLDLLVCNIDTDTKTFRIGAEKLIIRDVRKEFIEELVRIHRSP